MHLMLLISTLLIPGSEEQIKWSDYTCGIILTKNEDRWIVKTSDNEQFISGDQILSVNGRSLKPEEDLAERIDEAINEGKEKIKFVVRRFKDPADRRKKYDTIVLQVKPMIRLHWVLSRFDQQYNEAEAKTVFTLKGDQRVPMQVFSLVVVDKAQKAEVVVGVSYRGKSWLFMKSGLFEHAAQVVQCDFVRASRQVLDGGTVLEVCLLTGQDAKAICEMAESLAQRAAEAGSTPSTDFPLFEEIHKSMMVTVEGAEESVVHILSQAEIIETLHSLELKRLLNQKATDSK
jgi:hypothetical protein